MEEKKCWICGDVADTGEHKIKKSILKNLYNEDFMNGNMLHLKDKKITKLQGVNSNKVKYLNTLCKNCNNTFTQPFDRAFDTFVNYIQKNRSNIEKTRYINFEDVYGDDFGRKQTNLFKYCTKILGCDLYEHKFNVPNDLIQLLNKEYFETALKITFSINEKMLVPCSLVEIGYGIGSLTTSIENLKTRKEVNTWYQFEITLGYISIHIFYNSYSDIGLGSEWIANKQYVYLGSSNDDSLLRTLVLYELQKKSWLTLEEYKLREELLLEEVKINNPPL